MSDKDEVQEWMPAVSGEEGSLEEWVEDWGWDDGTPLGSESEGAIDNHQDDGGAIGWALGEGSSIRGVESSFTANLSEGALGALRRVLETNKTKYPLQNVLSSTGVRLRRGGGGCATANCPFPVHPLRSPTFKVDLANPNLFWCEACGVSGDVFDYVGALRGVSFLTDQFELLTGKSLRSQLGSEYAEQVEQVTTVSRREEIEGLGTSASMAPDVYRALLKRLPLYEAHHDFLTDCGLAVGCGESNEYRSLPPSVEERVAIAEDLVADGYDLGVVNGFFRLPDDAPDQNLRARWCFGGDLWGCREVGGGSGSGEVSYPISGIIVPVRDRNGQVVQLVVENALPPRRAPSSVKNTWPPPASILMTPRRAGGAGSELSGSARLHHARATDGTRNQYPGSLWLAEGALKADVISGALQAPAVGVPSCGQLIDEVLREARLYRRLFVAPDRHESEHVETICRKAESLGLEVYVASWNFSNVRGVGSYLGEGEGGLEWVAPFESWLYGTL